MRGGSLMGNFFKMMAESYEKDDLDKLELRRKKQEYDKKDMEERKEERKIQEEEINREKKEEREREEQDFAEKTKDSVLLDGTENDEMIEEYNKQQQQQE